MAGAVSTLDEPEPGSFRIYTNQDKQNLDCRFYEPKYPEIESLVMVNVRTIADMGAYVSLLEYNKYRGANFAERAEQASYPKYQQIDSRWSKRGCHGPTR